MANTTMKLIVLAICINTMMFIGVNYTTGGEGASDPQESWVTQDIYDVLLKDTDSFKTKMDSYVESINSTDEEVGGFTPNLDINGTGFGKTPSETSGDDASDDDNDVSFLDGLRIIYSFIPTLIKIAWVPLTVMFSGRLPPLIGLFFGFPLAILNFVAILFLIRGGGAP